MSDPLGAFAHDHGHLSKLAMARSARGCGTTGAPRACSTRRAPPRGVRAPREAPRRAPPALPPTRKKALFPSGAAASSGQGRGRGLRLEASHDAICGTVVRMAHLADHRGDGQLLALYERFEASYARHSHDEAHLFDELKAKLAPGDRARSSRRGCAGSRRGSSSAARAAGVEHGALMTPAVAAHAPRVIAVLAGPRELPAVRHPAAPRAPTGLRSTTCSPGSQGRMQTMVHKAGREAAFDRGLMLMDERPGCHGPISAATLDGDELIPEAGHRGSAPGSHAPLGSARARGRRRRACVPDPPSRRRSDAPPGRDDDRRCRGGRRRDGDDARRGRRHGRRGPLLRSPTRGRCRSHGRRIATLAA